MMTAGAEEALARASHEVRMKLRLTSRWTQLIPHDQQSLFFWSPVRFKNCSAGRRSGKTATRKRHGVVNLVRKGKQPYRKLYGAPTNGQARDIFWEDLKALVPEQWIAEKNETRQEIVTHWGAMLRVFGFDRPRRIEGVEWDDIDLDEFADCPKGCFAYNIGPALSTRGREGRATLFGVPDEVGRNQAEYEELYEKGLKWHPDPDRCLRAGGDPEICSYWWPSSDIISEKENEAAKRRMDPLAYQQEYGGRFVKSGGKVLPQFDTKTHVSDYYTAYAPSLALDWSLDFGTRWAASLIGQAWKGHVWIIDEIALQDSSTDVAVSEFISRVHRDGYTLRRLRVFGDASGRHPHSNTGESDYEIIEDRLQRASIRNVEWLPLTHNPLVKDTVNAVRGRVATADGVIHLHIHPRCVRLIQDCKIAPWPDGSNNLKDYHWLAALRYYLYTLFGDTSGGMSTGTLDLPNLRAAADR